MTVFPHYPERRHICLDGIWDFSWLGFECDIVKLKPAALKYDGHMAVPGVFDTCIDLFGRRGVGVYRRKLHLESVAGQKLCLKIGGLGLYARLWWDNREIGECKLPYSTVDYDFDAGKGTEHELIIAVDNRFDPGRIPLFNPNYDFYGYGGIYRSVSLQVLPVLRVERVRVSTMDVSKGLVQLKILLGGKAPSELEFSVGFDYGLIKKLRKKVVKGEIVLEQLVPNFSPWSPGSPSLHTVQVKIIGDSIVERFGIRTVRTEGQKILVNGKPVRLVGVNRHEAHPELGPAQTSHLMLDDIRLMKDLGCNFVRCVHYPQDQAFLDICDETGMLVWQESMGWNNTGKEALDPQFRKLQIEQTRLMVCNSINHPSVILWGFMNEGCSETKAGRRLYMDLAETVRAEDPSLLVTFASNKCEKDLCFDFVDVIAINIYPGWIWPTDWLTETSKMIKPCVEAKAKFASSPDLAGKPFIISEIGACALYGCHDRANAQWSEEFQAEYFAEACRCVLGNPRFAGIALWQMFDTRSFVNAGEVRCKPRGFNCAGLLDEYRRPKLAYDTVRKIFHGNSKAHK
ncbi:MAG TPA: hypothetical protein DCZ94_08270 [Lentisphaeria bacterium]|nr:MAG: hypothetical protein A2X48_19750 [Lentisphaerae bacterium GWF2_49_21]HBC86932.1 hypothetical protein [Lentisphaeria bacterium]